MGMAISWFTRHGYIVCLPLTDSQPYDLIVDDGQALSRVSVKTTTRKNVQGNYVVGLRTQGGNKSQTVIKYFDPNSCDMLYVVTGDGTEYVIPSDDILVTSSISLGKKYQKYVGVV